MYTDKWFPSSEDSTIVAMVSEAPCCNPKLSAEAGKTVNVMVPVLLSKIPGSADISSQHIKPHNRKLLCDRFPGAWEHYEQNKSVEIPSSPEAPKVRSGTPLDKADFLPRDKIAWLMTLGFSSIEQLAEMSDTTAQGLRGAIGWRKKAIEFLKRT